MQLNLVGKLINLPKILFPEFCLQQPPLANDALGSINYDRPTFVQPVGNSILQNSFWGIVSELLDDWSEQVPDVEYIIIMHQ